MKDRHVVFDMNGNAMDSFSSRRESLRSEASASSSSSVQAFHRVVLLDWIAGRGIVQDGNHLYVTDALDNSVKRFEKVRTRESGTVTQLVSQSRLSYLPEAIGGLCLIRDSSLLAVTNGTQKLCIFEFNNKTPRQTVQITYADAPRPGQRDKSNVNSFSSVCETSDGAILVGFCGSLCVSELISKPNEINYSVSNEHELSETLRAFSYSPRFDRLLVTTANNQAVLTDRRFQTVQQIFAPIGHENWEPWLTLLVDSGACLISDRRGITNIWVHSALDGSCLFKLVDEVVPYGWSFRPVKRRRGSRTALDASAQFNSELIVYNSQVKSLERFFFTLPTLVPNPT